MPIQQAQGPEFKLQYCHQKKKKSKEGKDKKKLQMGQTGAKETLSVNKIKHTVDRAKYAEDPCPKYILPGPDSSHTCASP
jgi:hypothetical protein